MGGVHEHERREPLGGPERPPSAPPSRPSSGRGRPPTPSRARRAGRAGRGRTRRRSRPRRRSGFGLAPWPRWSGATTCQPALGQRLEPVGEVLLGPREAVDEEERAAALAGLGDGRARRAVGAGHVDRASGHKTTVRRRGPAIAWPDAAWEEVRGDQEAGRLPRAPDRAEPRDARPSSCGGCPTFDTDEVIPELTAPDRPLAGACPPPSPSRRSCCRPCAGRRCSTPSACHAGLRRLLSHYLAGQFVSNVLPTTIGGDVLRVSRLSQRDRRVAQLVRLGRARAPHRLARAADHQRRRLPREPAAAAPRHGHPRRPRPRLRHARSGSSACSYAAADQRIGGRFAARDGWRRFAGAVHLGPRPPAPRPGVAALNVLLVGLRLPARAGAGRRRRRPGPRPRRDRRPHRAARVLPRRRHRPGAPDRHLRARRARGRVRRSSSARSAWPPRRPSPSGCCCTCSTSA